MSDKTKKILKFFGVGIIWVYILSIRVSGHTLFFHANDIFVQNQIVASIDQTFEDSYMKLQEKVRLAWDAISRSSSQG